MYIGHLKIFLDRSRHWKTWNCTLEIGLWQSPLRMWRSCWTCSIRLAGEACSKALKVWLNLERIWWGQSYDTWKLEIWRVTAISMLRRGKLIQMPSMSSSTMTPGSTTCSSSKFSSYDSWFEQKNPQSTLNINQFLAQSFDKFRTDW